MNLAIISLTKAGSLINAKLTKLLWGTHDCSGYYKGRCDKDIEQKFELTKISEPLQEWCKKIFCQADGIIFIGACGIAVRTIAPFLQDKTKDPLVLVIDERASYVISLLSGHIGGGNELAVTVSKLLEAVPVITTATDINNSFAVDLFAKKANLYIHNMKTAKEISAAILEGKKIGLVTKVQVEGSIPKEIVLMKENIQKFDLGICISFDESEKPFKNTLNLIPRQITIGVGCKKNTDTEQLEAFMLQTLHKKGISIHSVNNIVSIDLKKDEACIKHFAEKYSLKFITYSADELKTVAGEFEESDFVKRITGVGNVCERSAMFGGNKTLLLEKQAYDGMTIALAKETRGIRFE